MTATGFTDTAMNQPEPSEEEKQEWSTREWAIYTLRELMLVVSCITEDELLVLQDILMVATERNNVGLYGGAPRSGINTYLAEERE